MTNVAIALAPVVAFLVMLWLMDSFRLVRPTSILTPLTYGAAAAAAVLWLHEWLLHVHQVPAGILNRYIAPLTEESEFARSIAPGAVSVAFANPKSSTFTLPSPVSAMLAGFYSAMGGAIDLDLFRVRASTTRR